MSRPSWLTFCHHTHKHKQTTMQLYLYLICILTASRELSFVEAAHVPPANKSHHVHSSAHQAHSTPPAVARAVDGGATAKEEPVEDAVTGKVQEVARVISPAKAIGAEVVEKIKTAVEAAVSNKTQTIESSVVERAASLDTAAAAADTTAGVVPPAPAPAPAVASAVVTLDAQPLPAGRSASSSFSASSEFSSSSASSDAVGDNSSPSLSVLGALTGPAVFAKSGVATNNNPIAPSAIPKINHPDPSTSNVHNAAASAHADVIVAPAFRSDLEEAEDEEAEGEETIDSETRKALVVDSKARKDVTSNDTTALTVASTVDAAAKDAVAKAVISANVSHVVKCSASQKQC